MRIVSLAAIFVLSGCNLFTSSGTNSGGSDLSTPNNATNNGPNNTTDMSTPNNAAPDMGNDPPDMDAPDGPRPDMPDTPDMNTPDSGPSGDFGWDRSGRVAQNLLLYYTFEEGTGTDVLDRAPRGGTPPLMLGSGATWLMGRNGVHVTGPGRVTGAAVGPEIFDWATPKEELTVEAWIKPDNLTQDGPARIVTFSSGSSDRNFTIGQDADSYNIRFMVNDREFGNGTPELYAAMPATLAETHVAFTYDGLRLRVYINGIQGGTSLRTGGMQSWDRNMAFVLGNESAASRPWAGEIYKLAVYDRALTPPEVLQNFLEGSGVE